MTLRRAEHLNTVHPRLADVVRLAAASLPFGLLVVEGVRTLERQKQLLAKGASRTLKSKHLAGPDGYAQVVDLARQRAQAEIEEACRLREAEAKAQAEAERVAREEQQRLNDFYRRCRLREMEVRSAEDLGQTYWGLPLVRARAQLMRERFGFECWR